MQLLGRKPSGGDLRAWVAGCATGEEAHSIAMLLHEALQEQTPPRRVQIFASDIDDAALATARRGVYPSSLLAELEGIYATVDMPLLAFNELALLSRTNRAVQRQLGIDDGWVGRHFAALPWPAGMPGIHALFDLVQASGRTEVMQLDDVGARDWMMRLMPRRGADLAPDGVLMLLEETTQLKLSQRAAMRSNAQLQQLMERSPQLVCICDPAGRLQMANPVFERFHAIAPGGAACRHQCAACRRRHGPHQEQSPGQHDPRDPYADERGAGPVAHDAQGRPPAAGAREADQGLRGRPGAYQHPG